MPAFTVGDSWIAEAWKTSTLTFAPPGGEGRDNVVGGGSGYGRAEAALPPRSETVRAPTPSAAVNSPLRDLDR
jgi:hypothetical protein